MDTWITMVGFAVTDVKTADVRGSTVASFRFLSTGRRFERGKGWVDVDPNFVTVTCWRSLAMNVASSVAKGHPLVVFGKLKVRPWDRADRVGSMVEIDAWAVGHDLTRGTSAFRFNERAAAAERDETLEETAARVRSSAEEEGFQAERAIHDARRAAVLDAERVLLNGSAALRSADADAEPARREGPWSAHDSRGKQDAGDQASVPAPPNGPRPVASPDRASDPDAASPPEPGADESDDQAAKRDGKRTMFGLAKQRDPASV